VKTLRNRKVQNVYVGASTFFAVGEDIMTPSLKEQTKTNNQTSSKPTSIIENKISQNAIIEEKNKQSSYRDY